MLFLKRKTRLSSIIIKERGKIWKLLIHFLNFIYAWNLLHHYLHNSVERSGEEGRDILAMRKAGFGRFCHNPQVSEGICGDYR